MWLQRVEAATRPKPAVLAANASPDPNKPAHHLCYVLAPEYSGKYVTLAVRKARLRANGEIASTSAVTDLAGLLATRVSYMDDHDEDLVRLFTAMRTGLLSYAGNATEPRGKLGAQLLRELAERGLLLWTNSWEDAANGLVYPLKAAPRRGARLAWLQDGGHDMLRLGWQFEDVDAGKDAAAMTVDFILPTDPPWYIDNLSCGELTLVHSGKDVSFSDLQMLVAQAPPLAAKDRVNLSAVLLARGLHELLPMPVQMQQRILNDIAPVPRLLLGSLHANAGRQSALWHDFAQLSFDYDGVAIGFDRSRQVVRHTADGMEIIERDFDAEQRALDALREAGMATQDELHPGAVPPAPLLALPGVFQLPTQGEWLRFARTGLPRLAELGWRIDKTPDYRYDVTAIDDWYAKLGDEQEQSASPWFDLELGIVVNQARVPLLPVLVQLIRSAPQDFNPQAMAEHADDDQLLATIADGTRVALPWGRLKPILSTLGELYFNEKPGAKLRLSKLDAARLSDLASGTPLKWEGGERLRAMGEKLTRAGASMAEAPKAQGLQATLRDYQSDGVAWMQFLREHDLAGILADDMGLGKTIQTLTHILLEKEGGRLDCPALVVAPTSLMGNWQQEAARFTPGLRVLLLQGPDRAQHFEHLGEYDLVLTTYALLARDEKQLRNQQFHLVVLDESHYIKNTRSKVTQTAGQLNARHRLCLSGTPLENHLGELWSQMHFLMPGLLGDEKTFNSEFRNPIEKDGNEIKRALLSRRIKPFLLRRTKDVVAKELPAKTEIVLNVELQDAQRDLYENMRLAMDKKVREEIAKKGVARSQLVILDALLALRQVCCDPRLVRTNSHRKTPVPSAKLTLLIQIVQEMLEEGRKILIFSQFTSMLALIQKELDELGINYALLTGDTRDRGGQISAFQQGAVPVFLISLKAGGVGLNLTAADTVIHYDPWWNPAAENQATDRAWRIGQDKPVFVYRLIARDTLEEKIQELQRHKSELAEAMLSDGATHNVKMTQEDLAAIFAPPAEDRKTG
jgi:superfamily II DNA or RNA helicase